MMAPPFDVFCPVWNRATTAAGGPGLTSRRPQPCACLRGDLRDSTRWHTTLRVRPDASNAATVRPVAAARHDAPVRRESFPRSPGLTREREGRGSAQPGSSRGRRGKGNHEEIDLPRRGRGCLLGRDARSGDAGGEDGSADALRRPLRGERLAGRGEGRDHRGRRPDPAREHAGRSRHGRVGQSELPRQGSVLGRDRGRRTGTG